VRSDEDHTETAALHRIGLAGDDLTDIAAEPVYDQNPTPTPSTPQIRAWPVPRG
jgi:hypothetical protein